MLNSRKERLCIMLTCKDPPKTLATYMQETSASQPCYTSNVEAGGDLLQTMHNR